MEESASLTSQELLRINDQMNKCLCIIYFEERRATGFFCKLFSPNSSKNMNALISVNHVFNEEKLKKGINLHITLSNNKEEKIIDINNNRAVYTDREKDITIIEIKQMDNIEHFLELDDTIFMEDCSNKKTKGVLFVFFKR